MCMPSRAVPSDVEEGRGKDGDEGTGLEKKREGKMRGKKGGWGGEKRRKIKKMLKW